MRADNAPLIGQLQRKIDRAKARVRDRKLLERRLTELGIAEAYPVDARLIRWEDYLCRIHMTGLNRYAR